MIVNVYFQFIQEIRAEHNWTKVFFVQVIINLK
jgi:hypothetical protein